MATINVDKVVKRNVSSFRQHRQTIGVYLDEIRQTIRLFDSQKTSKAGLRNACNLLQQQLPGALESVNSLRERVATLNDECGGVLFDNELDKRAEWPRRTLARQLDSVCGYFEHLRSKCMTRGFRTGLQSAWRNWRSVVDAIDYAKRLNQHFASIIERYVRSHDFAAKCADINNGVDVSVSELRGTRAQVAEVLRQWGYGPNGEPLTSAKETNRRSSSSDNDDDDCDGFVVADELAGEDVDVLDERSIRDAELSEEASSEGDTSSDDSATQSNGTVLFEANMHRNNANDINQVERNGIKRGGRTLRKRKYRHINMAHAAPHLSALAELNELEEQNKRARTDDDTDDDDESSVEGEREIAISSSEEDSDELDKRIRRHRVAEKSKTNKLR